MELELTISKEYYLLAVDIFKVLALKREHRPIPAKDYLEARYNEYRKLKENSNLILKKIEDKLCPLEDRLNISASETPVGVSSKSLSDFISPRV
jgi:hypothetical protein